MYGGHTYVREEVLTDVPVLVFQILQDHQTGNLHENLRIAILQLVFKLLVFLSCGFQDV
jgi:hypothetical protein